VSPRKGKGILQRIVERCCGLDVHKASVTAYVRVIAGGEVRQEIRQFSATTRELLQRFETGWLPLRSSW
jgi:hypothetical protein